ncbi:electron transfer flavoprotein-ubiquinone oxidoreductase, partial [Vibrio parahaemolyticus]|nr:electron transfer flavoprotein-ubiquinone oxidoreductase [Vibrio parahaemolyticus]
KANFEPGIELRAKFTLFAEGARGHIGKQLINKFNLAEDKTPQHYAIGFKELWDIPAEQHQQGLVVHGLGWPLANEASGGSYLYHLEGNQVAVGLIVDLNYKNPHLSPFDEFQRFKH